MNSRDELIQAAMAHHGGVALQAKKHWIQGSIKHPGASRAAAKREGLPVREWAEKHKHDSGVTGDRAREALRLEAMHH